MTSVWPWIAVAGAGALHGLNPATGWAVAAVGGTRAGGRDRGRAWRALAPVALGHAAAIAAIAVLAALGLLAQRAVLPWLAGGLVVVVAAVRVAGHLPRRLHAAAGQAGLALWSFTVGAVHGTGMMLVPALIPLCLSGSPAREITASGSLLLALAAVAVHLAALLAVTGAMALLLRHLPVSRLARQSHDTVVSRSDGAQRPEQAPASVSERPGERLASKGQRHAFSFVLAGRRGGEAGGATGLLVDPIRRKRRVSVQSRQQVEVKHCMKRLSRLLSERKTYPIKHPARCA